MTDMAASSPKHVFVIYMQSTPDDVWRALTDPSMTKKYFHDTRVVSDFQVGSPIAYLLDEEAGPREAVRGTILESDPPRLLKTSFYFAENSHGGTERSEETVVTYAVEPVGEVVDLSEPGFHALPPLPVEPPERYRYHRVEVWTGTELLVWGGPGPAAAAYDPATDRWRRIGPGPLGTRNQFGHTWTGTELVVYGGATRSATRTSPTTRARSTTGPPTTR